MIEWIGLDLVIFIDRLGRFNGGVHLSGSHTNCVIDDITILVIERKTFAEIQ